MCLIKTKTESGSKYFKKQKETLFTYIVDKIHYVYHLMVNQAEMNKILKVL